MPLRALLDDREVVAPGLSKPEWDGLRLQTRRREHVLTLPCCGSQAFQRTSRRGLQHFYHAPGMPCDEAGETLDHLQAKLEVLRGCGLAGFEAHPEWQGNGWRADVLAVRGRQRVAFEVQWSRLSTEEALKRQRHYAEHGVRGCWFFRFSPEELKRPRDNRLVEARSDLPLFLLQREHGDGSRAYLNGRHYPLHQFVAGLLNGAIQFRRRMEIPRRQWITVRFFEVGCRRCGGACHAYCLDPPAYASVCGVPLPLHGRWYDAARAAVRPEVERSVLAFLLTDAGLSLRVGPMQSQRSARGDQRAFHCFHCFAPLSDYELFLQETAARESGEWAAGHETVVTLPRSMALSLPHWCLSSDGVFCHGS